MTKKEMEEKIKILEIKLSVTEEVAHNLAADVVELKKEVDLINGWDTCKPA